jgi:hypothetical protein
MENGVVEGEFTVEKTPIRTPPVAEKTISRVIVKTDIVAFIR